MRPDENKNLDVSGIKRQRYEWIGEQNDDDQTFNFAMTKTQQTTDDEIVRSPPVIKNKDIHTSIMSTVQSDDHPIFDSGSVASMCPTRFALDVAEGGS